MYELYSESEDDWSTDSEYDLIYDEYDADFTTHRNSSSRYDHRDLDTYDRFRRRDRRRRRSRSHPEPQGKINVSNGSGLVKAAAVMVGKAIFKLVKRRLGHRTQGGHRSPPSSKRRHDRNPTKPKSLPRRFRDTDKSTSSPSFSPPSSPGPDSPSGVPTITPTTALQNTSPSLHRSFSDLIVKADALYHSLSTTSHPSRGPHLALNREGAELLAHCNSLRERVECFVEDVEKLLVKDDEGRRIGAVSEGLREMWRDADGLRREVDGFVEDQRKRLGRDVFH